MVSQLKTSNLDLKRKHPLVEDETSHKRQKTQNNQANLDENKNKSDEEDDTSSGEEDEESEDDSGSESSDSSDESEAEAEDDDDNELDENKQFEVQESYHKLDEELIKQRTKIIREDGVALVSNSLDQIDDLFKNGKSLKFKKSNVIAKDSAILKEIGSQAWI
ncbi:unnamed protein product [[Candida] boidinii]|nr:unnamed protein product [[Candida] boidinii]